MSQHAAVGRLSQVCQRWIYSACLCFALDSDERARSAFAYQFSVYQVEYSRNLLFRNGAQMQRVFDAIVDRTRSRLDVPRVTTLFGAKRRPHRDRKTGPPRLAAVIETPTYDLSVFKLHFGRLTCKAYTKGEHVLRFEAIVHNTAELRCGRVLERFGDIMTRLAGITGRFCSVVDCVDVGGIDLNTLDQLATPSTLGVTRVGGIDLDKPRMRHALAAVLALAAAPHGFTVAQFSAKVHAMTGRTDHTIRQAAYDLRKLRGKQLIDKPGRTRRYQVPPNAGRTIAALLTLRDQGHRAHPRRRPQPTHGTQTRRLDRRRPRLRTDPQSRCTPSSATSASPPHRRIGAYRTHNTSSIDGR